MLSALKDLHEKRVGQASIAGVEPFEQGAVGVGHDMDREPVFGPPFHFEADTFGHAAADLALAVCRNRRKAEATVQRFGSAPRSHVKPHPCTVFAGRLLRATN